MRYKTSVMQRTKSRAYYKAHRKERLSQMRSDNLRRKYGITAEEYEKQLSIQGGVCAVCGRPPKRWRLSVDHDHKTGRKRGLLCVSCNRALGRLEHLMSAFEKYLSDPPWR